MFTTSQDLVEDLKSEFDGDKTKALSTLNQLENKKLIYSKYRNFEGKGKCRIFYPNKKGSLETGYLSYFNHLIRVNRHILENLYLLF